MDSVVRITAKEMWAKYFEWLRTRSSRTILRNVELNEFFSRHKWTYLEMRNALHPGLYGNRR